MRFTNPPTPSRSHRAHLVGAGKYLPGQIHPYLPQTRTSGGRDPGRAPPRSNVGSVPRPVSRLLAALAGLGIPLPRPPACRRCPEQVLRSYRSARQPHLVTCKNPAEPARIDEPFRFAPPGRRARRDDERAPPPSSSRERPPMPSRGPGLVIETNRSLFRFRFKQRGPCDIYRRKRAPDIMLSYTYVDPFERFGEGRLDRTYR